MSRTLHKHPSSTTGAKLRLAVLAASAATIFSWAGHANAAAIVAWGNDSKGQVSNAPTGNDFTRIAGGNDFGVALKADGTVVTWGKSLSTLTGNDFIDVAAESGGYYGLHDTGTANGMGFYYGGTLHGLASIVAGGSFIYGLTSDGSVVANGVGPTTSSAILDAPTGSGYTALAATNSGALALKSGSVTAWGNAGAPSGSNFIAIAGAQSIGYGLTSDGQIIASSGYAPSGSDFIAIAGDHYGDAAYALKSDGSIVGWNSADDALSVPTGNNFIGIAAGHGTVYALATVPEPATGALALLGLGASLAWPRRQRRED